MCTYMCACLCFRNVGVFVWVYMHDRLCMTTIITPHVFHFAELTQSFLDHFSQHRRSVAPTANSLLVSHELRGNTTPFGLKLSKYGLQPIWSCLPTPWRVAQEIVHHVPNSINSNFITRTQQRQITMVLIFSALSFQTIQVFLNGECNCQQHILCKMLIVAKDKNPSVSIG